MPTHSANWEDDENNRIVSLSVEYQLTDGRVDIEDVRPTAVTFLDQGVERRRIGVWTEKGRQVLRRQHAIKVGAGELRQQIESGLFAESR